ARGRTPGNHFGDWRVGSGSSADPQLVAYQFAFVLHTPLSVAVLHSSNQRELIRTTRALLDSVKELRRANCPGDLPAVVFEIEIARTHGAFGVVDIMRNPVAVEVSGRVLLREREEKRDISAAGVHG